MKQENYGRVGFFLGLVVLVFFTYLKHSPRLWVRRRREKSAWKVTWKGVTCFSSLMQKHASGMTFQQCAQPQHCVKVVEPHENTLEVLNGFAWAPVRHLCVHMQGSAEELQGTRGKFGLLECPHNFLGEIQ